MTHDWHCTSISSIIFETQEIIGASSQSSYANTFRLHCNKLFSGLSNDRRNIFHLIWMFMKDPLSQECFNSFILWTVSIPKSVLVRYGIVISDVLSQLRSHFVFLQIYGFVLFEFWSGNNFVECRLGIAKFLLKTTEISLIILNLLEIPFFILHLHHKLNLEGWKKASNK